MNKICKNDEENDIEDFYIVSLHIAKSGVPHNIAKTLIRPGQKDDLSCILALNICKKINAVQLSNSTVSKWIHALSDSLEKKLMRRLKTCEFLGIDAPVL